MSQAAAVVSCYIYSGQQEEELLLARQFTRINQTKEYITVKFVMGTKYITQVYLLFTALLEKLW